MRPTLAIAAVALLAAAPSTHAQTQMSPAGDQSGGYDSSGDYSSSSSRGSMEDRAERSGQSERAEPSERPETPERASQDLIRQLRLRADQQAAFHDYQRAFSAGGAEPEGDDATRLAAMTTPQRLDDAARNMDRDRADFERVSAATRRFYAALDTLQRRTFDRLTAPREDVDDGGDDDGGRNDGGGRFRPPPPGR